MPYLALQVSEDIKNTDELLKDITDILVDATGKPQKYCMVSITKVNIAMSGDTSLPTAYGDVKAIGGFTAGICSEISKAICELLSEKHGISGERVYLTFTDVMASRWGWNGSLFG